MYKINRVFKPQIMFYMLIQWNLITNFHRTNEGRFFSSTFCLTRITKTIHHKHVDSLYYHISQWWTTFLPPWVKKELWFLSRATPTTLAKVHIIFKYSSIYIFFLRGPGEPYKNCYVKYIHLKHVSCILKDIDLGILK